MTSRISPYRCPDCESKDYEATKADSNGMNTPVDHNYRCDNCGNRFNQRKDMREKEPDYWLKPQTD